MLASVYCSPIDGEVAVPNTLSEHAWVSAGVCPYSGRAAGSRGDPAEPLMQTHTKIWEIRSYGGQCGIVLSGWEELQAARSVCLNTVCMRNRVRPQLAEP